MDVDGEGDVADGVVVAGTGAEIVVGDSVTAVDAAALADADLGGGGDDAEICPGVAEGAQAVDQFVEFAAGAPGGGVRSRASVPLMPYSWLAIRAKRSSRMRKRVGLA